jgi:hypothetical protein
MNRARQRRLKRRRRRPRLSSSRGRLPRRRGQPPHIRRRRRRHRRRRRTSPRPRGQPHNHGVKRRRRRRQILRQPIPGRRSHMQRPRARTSKNPRRIDLRRQPCKIQNHHNPNPASRPSGADNRTSRLPRSTSRHVTTTTGGSYVNSRQKSAVSPNVLDRSGNGCLQFRPARTCRWGDTVGLVRGTMSEFSPLEQVVEETRKAITDVA